MAASNVGEILSLEFGSLHTALHESRVDDTDITGGQNWISTDGTVRLDPRYIRNCEVSATNYLTTGSGYGVWEPIESTSFSRFLVTESHYGAAVADDDNEVSVCGANIAGMYGVPTVAQSGLTETSINDCKVGTFGSDPMTTDTPLLGTGLYVTTLGQLVASGSNAEGLFGDGTLTNDTTTWTSRGTMPNFGTGVQQIYANTKNAGLVDEDGALWYWGAHTVSTYPHGTGQLTTQLDPLKVVNSGVRWTHGTPTSRLYVTTNGRLFLTGTNVGFGGAVKQVWTEVTTTTGDIPDPVPGHIPPEGGGSEGEDVPDDVLPPGGGGGLTGIIVKALFPIGSADIIIVLTDRGIIKVCGNNALNHFGNPSVATGYNDATVWKAVPNLPFITDIAVGQAHVIALDVEGNVWTWGSQASNNHGQCGQGNSASIYYPSPILSDIQTISAQFRGGFAATSAGVVYAWGRGQGYAMGNNSTSNVFGPTLVSQWALGSITVGLAQWEQYVGVVNRHLYLVDLTQGLPLSFTSVNNGDNMGNNDWFFAQFERYIYGVNEDKGIYRKLIGEGTDGTGDWGTVELPDGPAEAPTATIYQPTTVSTSLAGATLAWEEVPSGWTQVVLEFVPTTGNRIGFRAKRVAGVPFRATIHLTLNTPVDWSKRDMFQFVFGRNTLSLQAPDITIAEANVEGVDAVRWTSPNTLSEWVVYRMANLAEGSRDAVKKLSFGIDLPPGSVEFSVGLINAGGVWLSVPNDASVTPPATPPFKPLYYETTYFDEDTNFESAPSPTAVIPASAQDLMGNWVKVEAEISNDDAITHVNFYRVIVDEDGVKTRYRIGQEANTGIPTITDKYSLDEVLLLPTYRPSVVPVNNLRGICAWQNRLVVCDKRTNYISQDGEPLSFESIEGAFDPFNEARGLTYTPDDNQAEVIQGVCSNDSLFTVTNNSVRILYGSTPSNWRAQKMPGSEGACGRRAFCSYLNGVLVLTPTGRLLYHYPGQPKPEDVGERFRPRKDNAGLLDYATDDAVVAVRQDGQIEIRSEGKYLILDTDGRWRQGTHSHPSQSVLFVPGHPPRWLGTNGKLYEGDSDEYLTDGGDTGVNGIEVLWYVDTKKFRKPRMRVKNVDWGDSQESTNADVRYPSLTPIGMRDTKTYKKRAGKRNMRVGPLAVDTGIQFRIAGDAYTVVEECRVTLVPMSGARQI